MVCESVILDMFDIKKITFDRFFKKKNKTVPSSSPPSSTPTPPPPSKSSKQNDDDNEKEEEIFETSSFAVLPDKYLDRYQKGDVIITITEDHQYMVYEPQFLTTTDKHAYDKIMKYKQLIRTKKQKSSTTSQSSAKDNSSANDMIDNTIAFDQLMTNIKNAATDLGLYEVMARNYKAFSYYAKRDIFGFEVIDAMMNDAEHLEDITCSNYRSVGVIHRDYLEHEVLRTNICFQNPKHMNVFLERMSRKGGKHISSSEPIADFHLEESYRFAIISDEITSSDSSSLSIRLKSPKPFTVTEMIANNVIPASVVAVIWKMLDFNGTGLVIGGTGAGKTSMLNTFFPLLHKSSKIMSIEDASELDIPQFDWTPLLIDVPIISELYNKKFQELLNAILRHRPKMISVGEVRGKSTANLFDVMSTGHSSLASFHATNEHGATNRIINEFGVHPASFSQLWFIIHVGTVIDKDKKHIRKCVSFDEVFYDGEKIDLINLCKYDAISDAFQGSALDNMISKSRKLKYISRFDASTEMKKDLEHRMSLLQECIVQKAYTPKKVMEILSRYYAK